MIREALQLIQDTATKAAGIHKLPSEGPHVTRSLMPDGKVDVVNESIPPRKHIVHDIESLASFVSDQADVVIWHDAVRVVAVLNDASYRDSHLSMPLPIHPTFQALDAMDGEVYTQKELIDFLRLNLKKEVDAAVPGFISAIREVRFVNNASGESTIQHGRESMGKRIEQSVTGVDALPEDFALRVPLWLHLDAVVSVECALIVDTADGKFRCGPKPGAIEQAKVAGQKWLGEQLEGACEKAVVYFGAP